MLGMQWGKILLGNIHSEHTHEVDLVDHLCENKLRKKERNVELRWGYPTRPFNYMIIMFNIKIMFPVYASRIAFCSVHAKNGLSERGKRVV